MLGFLAAIFDIGIKIGSDRDNTFIGGKGTDFIFGRGGNDYIDGGKGNDWLFGGEGNDTILGGAGHDVILGGVGNDTLTGGAGIDVFFFDNRVPTGSDKVTDFSLGDRIVTTTKIHDTNDDGIITFGPDRRLDLFGDRNTDNDVAITLDSGTTVTKLIQGDTVKIGGVTFYTYFLEGSESHSIDYAGLL